MCLCEFLKRSVFFQREHTQTQWQPCRRLAQSAFSGWVKFLVNPITAHSLCPWLLQFGPKRETPLGQVTNWKTDMNYQVERNKRRCSEGLWIVWWLLSFLNLSCFVFFQQWILRLLLLSTVRAAHWIMPLFTCRWIWIWAAICSFMKFPHSAPEWAQICSV